MWSIGFGGGFRDTSLAVLNDSFWLRAKSRGRTTERRRREAWVWKQKRLCVCVIASEEGGKGRPDTKAPRFYHSHCLLCFVFHTVSFGNFSCFHPPFVSPYASFYSFSFSDGTGFFFINHFKSINRSQMNNVLSEPLPFLTVCTLLY